jgi:hypothetical protein
VAESPFRIGIEHFHEPVQLAIPQLFKLLRNAGQLLAAQSIASLAQVRRVLFAGRRENTLAKCYTRSKSTFSVWPVSAFTTSRCRPSDDAVATSRSGPSRNTRPHPRRKSRGCVSDTTGLHNHAA